MDSLNEFEDLGFSKVDYGREARTGFPEVVFGQGKTVPQVRAIVERLMQAHGKALVTLATEEMASAVREDFSDAAYNPASRLITVGEPSVRFPGKVLVLCAGTSDVPVAEEAAGTAQWMGCEVEKIYDVGVAGIDRLLAYRDKLREANVLIVVAGMEGALASVVGGMVRRPVIAVPTSVGYGAHFQGLTPLLSMLTSCAAGVTVVNIDNGFGAGYQAAIILQLVMEAGTQ
ncbi:nickel pincer cofactor biosynthesis protein LarB [Paenibacillus nasutitermitis]|uniref:1-(5-phosphoribosyl)-5-amino-4-imidazole-carboxylate carboxylase n=1 Tax=Paenibacillus nasutitermitis TaxID=1652958 RepID=A0A916ZEP6_9BACL|nr:nickel pincer cofactor biosynthesis protein LarB [Paenibacillus nasutitermitis]GGD90568.1 1-(5-phosphoribosyl)-5-amino-4-imidazole-carboxylate carboxylase [Paenibacillus nasutitermitis]